MLGPEELALLEEARDFLDVYAEPDDFPESNEDDEAVDYSILDGTRYAWCYDSENFQTVALMDLISVELLGTSVLEQYAAMISFEDSVTGELMIIIDDEFGGVVTVDGGDEQNRQVDVTGQQEYVDMFAQGLLALKKNLG